MRRIVLAAALVVSLSVLIGCQRQNRGRAQLMPPRTRTSLASVGVVKVAGAGEVDIVEQVAINRQTYRQALELLVEHYSKTGDNMKQTWAKKELAALNTMPQYKYIIEAERLPNLKATNSIPEADEIYMDGRELHRQAEKLMFVKDNDLLRIALDRYNQLIKKYPSSDKIDDAAFEAGRIYEHFKDYNIALLYYQRAYQWDPATIHPARFKAAYILDKFMHSRQEALELYQEALQEEGGYEEWKEFAQKRIREITKTEEGVESRQ